MKRIITNLKTQISFDPFAPRHLRLNLRQDLFARLRIRDLLRDLTQVVAVTLVERQLRAQPEHGKTRRAIGAGPTCRCIRRAARSSAPSNGRPSTSTMAAFPTARNVSQANDVVA